MALGTARDEHSGPVRIGGKGGPILHAVYTEMMCGGGGKSYVRGGWERGLVICRMGLITWDDRHWSL